MLKIKILKFNNCKNINIILNSLNKYLYLNNKNTNNNILNKTIDILNDIKKNNIRAILEYTRRFDLTNLKNENEINLNIETLNNSILRLNPKINDILHFSANRIKKFHLIQKNKYRNNSFCILEKNNNILGQKISYINRIGIYAPNSKSSYISSIFMNTIPAKLSNSSEIIMTTPIFKNIKKHIILAAAFIMNIDEIFNIGGVQAIGSLAYGNEKIKPVNKIVGPGNIFVTEAKKIVFGKVGIDIIAGPSEILILCDKYSNSEYIAKDLLSQSEHDSNAKIILISTSIKLIHNIIRYMNHLIINYNKNIIKSIKNNSLFIFIKNINKICDIINYIAPEHLEINFKNSDIFFNKINNVGTIFLNKYSNESLGDYCIGFNHVLPTFKTAKFFSPLSVNNFLKYTNFVNISKNSSNLLNYITFNFAKKEKLFQHSLTSI